MKSGSGTHKKATSAAKSDGHPSVSTFVKIGLILFVITGIEFSIVYTSGMRGVVVTTLFALSAIKFALVAGVFMHLKFDPKFLTWIFSVGVVLATIITLALKFVNMA